MLYVSVSGSRFVVEIRSRSVTRMGRMVDIFGFRFGWPRLWKECFGAIGDLQLRLRAVSRWRCWSFSRGPTVG